jgi:hypothetical protein
MQVSDQFFALFTVNLTVYGGRGVGAFVTPHADCNGGWLTNPRYSDTDIVLSDLWPLEPAHGSLTKH